MPLLQREGTELTCTRVICEFGSVSLFLTIWGPYACLCVSLEFFSALDMVISSPYRLGFDFHVTNGKVDRPGFGLGNYDKLGVASFFTKQGNPIRVDLGKEGLYIGVLPPSSQITNTHK